MSTTPTTYKTFSAACRAFRRVPLVQKAEGSWCVAYVYPNRDDVDEGRDYQGFAVVPVEYISDWTPGEVYYTACDPGEVAEEIEDQMAGDDEEEHDRAKDERRYR
jgi:hypothetical protein